MSKIIRASLLALVMGFLLPAEGRATTIDLGPANGNWIATTSGEPCCQYILSVGAAWEAANSGWNSSLSYNSSAWVAYSGGWYPSNGSTSDFYTREIVTLSGTINSATFLASVDDDVQVWVNGALVVNDVNGGCCNTTPVDITSYLADGQNLIAIKANNNQGGYSASFSGSVTETPSVPEPGSLTLMGAGLIGLALLRLAAPSRRMS